MNLFYKLPINIKRIIYTFDNTFHKILRENVIKELKDESKYWCFILVRKSDNYNCLYSAFFNKRGHGLIEENKNYVNYCLRKEWKNYDNEYNENNYQLELSYFSDTRCFNPYFKKNQNLSRITLFD